VEVEQIADGLWRWTTRHPEWTPEEGDAEGWPPDVGCVYYEAPDAVVLIDPLVPSEPGERDRFWRALDRDVEAAAKPVAALLTVFWHERSASDVVERYDGATLWAHERAVDRLSVRVTDEFALGEPLPGGIEAIDANRRDEVVYWLREHGALVTGDVLLGAEEGGVRVCPDSWLPEGVGGAEFRASLRPLLELPVERVLVSHGKPVLENGREALTRALAA
jgi:glyoxylase-like metal-dependent hydrolase (beta-lactamase superfamily II)